MNRSGDPKSFFASSQRSDNQKFRTEDKKNWILQQTVRRLVPSHPMLFGVFISVLISIAITAMQTWAPWIGEYHDTHKRVVQAVLFTGIYFIVYVYGLRAWRYRSVFWPSICILFLLHVLGVFFYSNHVEPILVWQWPLVGFVEYYGTAFFLDWATRRFDHDARHKPANVEPGT